MDVEQLKVIAEGMGYKTRFCEAPQFKGRLQVEVETIKEGLNYYNWYRPDTTNNDQMIEIMEKLIHECIYHIRGGANPNDVHIRDKDYALVAKGKTINEAVCNAAHEYFKAAIEIIK